MSNFMTSYSELLPETSNQCQISFLTPSWSIHCPCAVAALAASTYPFPSTNGFLSTACTSCYEHLRGRNSNWEPWPSAVNPVKLVGIFHHHRFDGRVQFCTKQHGHSEVLGVSYPTDWLLSILALDEICWLTLTTYACGSRAHVFLVNILPKKEHQTNRQFFFGLCILTPYSDIPIFGDGQFWPLRNSQTFKLFTIHFLHVATSANTLVFGVRWPFVICTMPETPNTHGIREFLVTTELWFFWLLGGFHINLFFSKKTVAQLRNKSMEKPSAEANIKPCQYNISSQYPWGKPLTCICS